MRLVKSIEQYVAALPEKYQPIFNHAELSDGTSRSCFDRLSEILKVHNTLRNKLNRPVRVLDLGCAQGFFSLNLAKEGAEVVGIDYLSENIDICNALAAENHGFDATFRTDRIEDVITSISDGQYDLVLGLSVFHHIIHEKGIDEVKHLLSLLAQGVECMILELALAVEPLYWSKSQPQEFDVLLDDIAFVYQLGSFSTHLSSVKRPLFVASNRYWILGSDIQKILSWSTYPHDLAKKVYRGTRRYFISSDSVLKIYHFNHGVIVDSCV